MPDIVLYNPKIVTKWNMQLSKNAQKKPKTVKNQTKRVSKSKTINTEIHFQALLTVNFYFHFI